MDDEGVTTETNTFPAVFNEHVDPNPFTVKIHV
jgi:hypothetical protein